MVSELVAELRQTAKNAGVTYPEQHVASRAATLLSAQEEEIERLTKALTECAAPYSSPPTTVFGGAQYLAYEFIRRMELAAAALNEGSKRDG